MYPSAQDRLYETHPEVCFWALNGCSVVDETKTSEEGIARRKALLADEFSEAVSRYISPAYAPMVSGPDDILDAMAAAITACTGPDISTLPQAPPADERGLPMQIVYPSDIEQTRLSTLGSHNSP